MVPAFSCEARNSLFLPHRYSSRKDLSLRAQKRQIIKSFLVTELLRNLVAN